MESDSLLRSTFPDVICGMEYLLHVTNISLHD